MSTQRANSSSDAAIAHIAARQHGVVTLTQLCAAGLHKSVVVRRTQAGRLHRVHRGVYAVGHPTLSQEGQWMAAVLACGNAAVLSHQSAAALWKLLPPPSQTHVTIPGNAGRKRRRGIALHRSATLLPSQTTRRAGIPVTTTARTLTDLRRVVPSGRFAAALRQAEYLQLPIGNALQLDHTRSELEASFLRLCRRHRLPLPEVNVRIGRYTVDFLWGEHGLVVEVDGYRAHRGRQAFEDDRARDLELKLAGLRVHRFSHAQVTRQSALVAEAVRRVLGIGPGS